MTLNITLIKEFVEWTTQNTLGLLLVTLAAIALYRFFQNKYTLYCFKREKRPGDYEASRCYEDANRDFQEKGKTDTDPDDNKKNGRDYIYLISSNTKNKRYHRVVDLFTLDKLGYPKPSRKNNDSFSSKEYTLGKEIKIYNIISEIEVIRNLAKK